MATGTPPSAWWDETDEALATVLELLQAQADQVKKKGGRRRG